MFFLPKHTHPTGIKRTFLLVQKPHGNDYRQILISAPFLQPNLISHTHTHIPGPHIPASHHADHIIFYCRYLPIRRRVLPGAQCCCCFWGGEKRVETQRTLSQRTYTHTHTCAETLISIRTQTHTHTQRHKYCILFPHGETHKRNGQICNNYF